MRKPSLPFIEVSIGYGYSVARSLLKVIFITNRLLHTKQLLIASRTPLVFICVCLKTAILFIITSPPVCVIRFQQTRRCAEFYCLSVIVHEINIFRILKPQHKLECSISMIFRWMQYIYTGNHSIQS